MFMLRLFTANLHALIILHAALVPIQKIIFSISVMVIKLWTLTKNSVTTEHTALIGMIEHKFSIYSTVFIVFIEKKNAWEKIKISAYPLWNCGFKCFWMTIALGLNHTEAPQIKGDFRPAQLKQKSGVFAQFYWCESCWLSPSQH